jgi:DNA-binding response OmpR family regulator
MAAIAIINTSVEFAELLRDTLEDEGLGRAAVGYVHRFKRREEDVGEFFARNDPAVVIFDIAVPYEENWRYCREVRALPEAGGRRFITTTTNRAALEGLVGPSEALEIIGKPFDLEQLIEAVKRGLAGEEAPAEAPG